MTATLRSTPIYITDRDRNRLLKLIEANERSKGRRDDLRSLVSELERATIVDSQRIPRNVVTMNSLVSVVDLETSERMKITLVYPEDADASANRISVLAPIGSALLGFSVGDEIEWEVPAGTRRFLVAKVDYQPEAKRHFHL